MKRTVGGKTDVRHRARGAAEVMLPADLERFIDSAANGSAGGLIWMYSAGTEGEEHRAPVAPDAFSRQLERLVRVMNPGAPANFETGFVFLSRGGLAGNISVEFDHPNIRYYRRYCIDPADGAGAEHARRAISRLPRYVLAGEAEPLLLVGSELESAGDIAAVAVTGQSLLPEARETLRDIYGAEVYEMYWTAETGPVAAECPEHEGLHVLEPDVRVEVTDDYFSPAGEFRYGRLLITSGLNPLYRVSGYYAGDQGRLFRGRCRCGNEAPRVFELSAAFPDLFGHGGREIIPTELARMLAKLPLLQYQVAWKDDRVHFIYSTLVAEKEVESRAAGILKTVLGDGMPLTLESDIRLGYERKFYRITASRTHGQFPVSIVRMNTTEDEDIALLMESLGHSLRTKPGVLCAGRRVLAPPPDASAGDIAKRIARWARRAGLEWVDGPPRPAPLADTINTAAADIVFNIGAFDSAAREFKGAAARLMELGGMDAGSHDDSAEMLKFLGAAPAPILNIFRVGCRADKEDEGPLLIAASWSALSVDRVLAEIAGARVCDIPTLARAVDAGYFAARLDNIRLAGIQPEVAVKPAAVSLGDRGADRIEWHKPSCVSCGACAAVCPVSCINTGGGKVSIDPDKCMKCYRCIEACDAGALSPVFNADAVITGVALAERPGFLASLLGGPANARLFSPDAAGSEKQSKPVGPRGRPLYVLGLAVSTMQENAAALIRDGEIVGAVEEERFLRRKHYGWHPPGRTGVTISNDPKIRLEEALCRGAVDYLLKLENITLDDIDYIAVNGIPYRYWPTYTTETTAIEVGTLRTGRLIFVPHHLAHAASAYRVSGFGKAGVLTVDGRGDRITAAFFGGDGPNLETVFELPVMTERSIGGCYETITHILGLGAHGQGSTMALAAFGKPVIDISDCYSLERHDVCSIDMIGLYSRFGGISRSRNDPMLQEHKNLAASAQKALEEIILNLMREGMSATGGNICFAGGVALNCAVNLKVRLELRPGGMYVQPAAHDAGTALGAALEAHRFITGEAPAALMRHAYLGPEYSDDEIRAELERSGLSFTESRDIAADCAELIASGKIVCWRQGRLEFGPRALGNSSILAHPGRNQIHKRLNEMKSREPWRPFGPSILGGRESEYLESAFHSPFMLFTLPVIKEKRSLIPAVVHADGTTRPQVVDKEYNPLFHSLIEEFDKRSGLPMVVNTSFNTGAEPIACSPEDSVRNFTRLGADYLAIGGFLAENKLRKSNGVRRRADPPRSAAARRLHLRLGTSCDNACAHCTVLDVREWPERTTVAAVFEMAAGRKAGCSELVFMRGEPTLRKDLPRLTEAARHMGFTHIQIQTNGRRLSDSRLVAALLRAGVSFFEVSLYADIGEIHDDIAGAPGAFDETTRGIANAAASAAGLVVTVPVVRKNFLRLSRTVALLESLGARAVQFNFPRPVMSRGKWRTGTIARLSECAQHIRRAVREAVALGMSASTEGVPMCHLRGVESGAALEKEAWKRHRVADLNFVHDDFAVHREETRALPSLCADCAHAELCPSTWKAYIDIFGDYELKPVV